MQPPSPTNPAATFSVRAYFQLVRLPAVFTAMADIFLGFLLTHPSLSPGITFCALLAASSCLYLAGMVFNDVFDRAIDAKERPGRPIPSGRVGVQNAVALGVGLIVVGLAAAAVAGHPALEIAGGLLVLIFAYDGWLKTTIAGPIAMGGCRFLNVMLGACAAQSPAWQSPQLPVAAAMGLYVAGITWFARREAAQSTPTQLACAALLIQAAIGALIAIFFVGWPIVEGDRRVAIVTLAAVALFVDIRVAAAISDPAPRKVQAAVMRLLLAIVLLDATVVYWKTGDPMLAGATALLVVPAATLGRWIFVT